MVLKCTVDSWVWNWVLPCDSRICDDWQLLTPEQSSRNGIDSSADSSEHQLCHHTHRGTRGDHSRQGNRWKQINSTECSSASSGNNRRGWYRKVAREDREAIGGMFVVSSTIYVVLIRGAYLSSVPSRSSIKTEINRMRLRWKFLLDSRTSRLRSSVTTVFRLKL